MILDEFARFRDTYPWKNNAHFSMCLANNTKQARHGLDPGINRMYLLIPKENDFHVWVDFASFLTALGNNITDKKRFTLFSRRSNS